MYRKDAVIKAGGYSLYAHNFEDYFLWIQLKKYGKFYNLPQQLIKVRFNPSSSTIDEKWRGPSFSENEKRYYQERDHYQRRRVRNYLPL